MMAMPSVLNAYLGKPIGEICSNARAMETVQHRGAQFIGHVLRFDFGRDHGCRGCLHGAAADEPAAMCVERLFHRAPQKGLWTQRPADLSPCLIFIAPSTHVRLLGQTWMMACSPRNQIGIYWDGRIWTYHDERARVMSETEAEFLARFVQNSQHRHRTAELMYGEIPN